MTSVKHVNFVRRPLATLPVNHRRLSTEPWSERGAAVIIVNHPLPSSFILHPSSNVPSFEKGKEKKREKNIETAPTHHPPHPTSNCSTVFTTVPPLFRSDTPPFFLPSFLASCLLFHARLMEATFRGSTIIAVAWQFQKHELEKILFLPREGGLLVLQPGRDKQELDVNLLLKI